MRQVNVLSPSDEASAKIPLLTLVLAGTFRQRRRELVRSSADERGQLTDPPVYLGLAALLP